MGARTAFIEPGSPWAPDGMEMDNAELAAATRSDLSATSLGQAVSEILGLVADKAADTVDLALA